MKLVKPVVLALSLALLGAPMSVLAEKGGKHGKGGGDDYYEEPVPGGPKNRQQPQQKPKHQAPPQEQPRHQPQPQPHPGPDGGRISHFGDQDQRIVRDYYGGYVQGGKCPPGLAKKGNGCMPPGQAKKWAMGRPMPHGMVYHDLPPDLIVRLPPPPPGHRYVQVAGDVLLIAIGSSMVVDAIQDILR